MKITHKKPSPQIYMYNSIVMDCGRLLCGIVIGSSDAILVKFEFPFPVNGNTWYSVTYRTVHISYSGNLGMPNLVYKGSIIWLTARRKSTR